MSISINDALEYARDLTERIRVLAIDDPERKALEGELEEYRTEIRLAANRGRPLDALRRDLEHIAERVAGFESERIIAPFAATSFSVNDPEAYSIPINTAIDANNADTLATLRQRRAELERAIAMIVADSETSG
ncbi:hypothetical protein MNBD_ACTINO02-841 [hydrothermal vent metagenome]|uniref:Uncharacterized protein n=1 Tax=hydrothermal vent metagenome TaxID=652676 RepID=A0A3B0TGU4_9ZZZZ